MGAEPSNVRRDHAAELAGHGNGHEPAGIPEHAADRRDTAADGGVAEREREIPPPTGELLEAAGERIPLELEYALALKEARGELAGARETLEIQAERIATLEAAHLSLEELARQARASIDGGTPAEHVAAVFGSFGVTLAADPATLGVLPADRPAPADPGTELVTALEAFLEALAAAAANKVPIFDVLEAAGYAIPPAMRMMIDPASLAGMLGAPQEAPAC